MVSVIGFGAQKLQCEISAKPPTNYDRWPEQYGLFLCSFPSWRLREGLSERLRHVSVCRLRLKCDGTRAEIRFRLSAKRTSPFKSTGASIQSTTDSRGVRISGINTGYTMFRGSVKSTGCQLHSPFSPSLLLPCVIVCHHISTGIYVLWSICSPVRLRAGRLVWERAVSLLHSVQRASYSADTEALLNDKPAVT